MAKTFQLAIVAPDRSVLDDPVQSVVLPGVEGYFGIMADHEPMIAALKPGILEYLDAQNQRHFVAVSGGFAEVTGARVMVLADAAERSKEIDITRAEAALERARQALQGEDSSMSNEQATMEIERAMTRIRAAKSS
jgi:F-type H+-transporting ATPase subunit epsilon